VNLDLPHAVDLDQVADREERCRDRHRDSITAAAAAAGRQTRADSVPAEFLEGVSPLSIGQRRGVYEE